METITTNTLRRLLGRPLSSSRFRNAPLSTVLTSSSLLRSYSTQPPKGSNNAVKFWPFVAIIGIGTGGYVFMIKSRAESRHAPVRRLG